MEELTGKKIRILKACGSRNFFDDGHVAVITKIDIGGDAWADFNDQGNSFVNLCGSQPGVWCVGKYPDGFDIID